MTANGWGSREKARLALKKSRQISKHDDSPKVLNTEVEDIDNEIVNTKHLAMSSESLKLTGPKRSISRLVYNCISNCWFEVMDLQICIRQFEI